MKKATEEDHKGNYKEAYNYYQNALEYFMTAIKCKYFYLPKCVISFSDIFKLDEKNDRLKDPIRKRFVEYLDRAEMLKEFLNEQEKKQKEPIGANGASKK